jgi:ankyrin repeat protein
MIGVLTGQIAIVNRLLSAINNNNRLLSILDQVEKRNNRSIFLIAIQTGSIDMCSLLLTHRYIRWDTIDKYHMNAFHIAAENNHYELIQFLCNYIQKSEKLLPRLYINGQNEDGKTSLHVACEHGHRLSVEILLNYGADVFLANHLGQLPFHTALQNGFSQCVDLLIKNSKKNINEFQSSLSRRQSPLITACQYGFIDIVKILISDNIGINFDWNKEENPLEIAIKYR